MRSTFHVMRFILREFAVVAQLVEHFHGKEGVCGSNPHDGSSIKIPRLICGILFCRNI
jgi:hypothetical protein